MTKEYMSYDERQRRYLAGDESLSPFYQGLRDELSVARGQRNVLAVIVFLNALAWFALAIWG